MGKKNIIDDNRGSSMVLVIVCIGFISILGTILMGMSLNGLQMKDIERKSKVNFYTAETALDEIKAGLQEVVAAQLEEAYNQVIKQYLKKSQTEKRQIFTRAFIEGMTETLAEVTAGVPNLERYSISKIENCITNSAASLMTPAGENLFEKDSNIIEPEFLTLKNIKITYTDANHYQTTISTDITIKTPSVNFTTGPQMSLSFLEYGLIADNTVFLDSATNVKIHGNVYAGEGGLDLNYGSDLLIESATNIVTRGDISVAERSKLTVSDTPKVWAKNIATKKGTDTDLTTSIYIDGKCYVADDLMLNAKNSQVTLNGEYYGYNYLSSKIANPEDKYSPENSSAIIINGLNSNLDLTGVNNLFIAGRAYLDPSSRGNQSTEVQGKVLTGESLAVKGNQYAYMVPSQYLWCETNPVPLSKYNEKPSDVAEVDYNKTLDNPFPVDLRDYVDGYSKIFYQVTGAQDFVYYYLKFKSEEKANEYMQKYYEVYNSAGTTGIIDNQVKRYAKSIKINDSLGSIISAGNLFTFNTTTKTSSMFPGNINPDGDSLKEIAAILAGRYDSMKKELTETPTGQAVDENSLFNTLIKKETIEEDNIRDNYTDGVKTVIVDEYVVHIVDNRGKSPFVITGNSLLPRSGQYGIVIATGDIHVRTDFHGLILSAENIKLTTGVNVFSSKDLVSTILSKNNMEINRYFRDFIINHYQTGTGSGKKARVKISDLIVFDHWKKNEG